MDAFKALVISTMQTKRIDFKQVLNIVISQAWTNTTAQVNLLDIYNKTQLKARSKTFYECFYECLDITCAYFSSRGIQIRSVDPWGYKISGSYDTRKWERKTLTNRSDSQITLTVDASQGV